MGETLFFRISETLYRILNFPGGDVARHPLNELPPPKVKALAMPLLLTNNPSCYVQVCTIENTTWIRGAIVDSLGD